MRRAALLLLAAGAWAFGCGSAPQPPANVLLVTIDTLRSDHTSAYGYEHDTTPELRRVAEEGARFELAYAPTASTAPTHATILTGLYPIAHRLIKNGIPLSAEHETLVEVLRERGYQTAAIVSSFVLDAKFGFAQGFDVYEDDFDAATASFAVDEWEGHEVPAGFDRRGDATTEMAIRWLREDRDPARPFLLFVHYFDPHAPYVPPDEYVWRFHSLDRPTNERIDQLALRYGAAAAMVAENAIRRYDGEVAFTDREIGRLLKALDRAGLADRTLVVITADHGEGLMDHGYLLHGVDLHEESVRVPLLFRWRGTIPAGLSFPEPVELVDLAPTILELVGIDWRSKGLPGQSLAPALRGEARPDPDRPVYLYRRRFETELLEGIRLQGEQYGIRVGKWKYIESPELGRVELYDLERDPRELENLFSSGADDAERIARRLAEWKRAHERTGGEAEVSEDDRLRLEALGYVE